MDIDETIVLFKKYNDKQNKKEQIRKGEYTIEKKKNVNSNSYKFDEDTGEYKTAQVNKKLCVIIQKARLSKKLSQKDLAKKVNIQVGILNEYEAGKKKPDNNILGKLEKVLNVKLRGDNNKLGNSI